MPPKKSAASEVPSRRVRKKAEPSRGVLPESMTIEERAEPYRLMTAKFPIDDVTAEWSIGSNRDVDMKHVRQLCRLFDEHGLQRQDRAHRACLICRSEDVRAMCDHLGINAAPNDHSGDPPFFEGWSTVASHPAELLAGNHRIHALEEFLKQRKITDKSDRWWVCDIFDQGESSLPQKHGDKLTFTDTLPPEIQIELRANRSGTVLPDSHGQIWTELATCFEQDKSGELFSGAREEVELRMSRLLQLNGREQFPVRRLAILWKNDRWRAFVTRLCERKMGRDLFNISTFQKLSSYRIDDFIFGRFKTGMLAAWCVWNDVDIELELNKDYQQLSGLMEKFEPRELFYPECRYRASVDLSSPRRAGFFKNLDDHVYFSLYENLVDHGQQLIFSNPQEMLKSINAHGKVMQLVMTHVVMWLNDEPAKVNNREGNKPALVEDLVPVMASGTPIFAGREVAETEVAREKALGLQRDVLEYVETHAASFTEAANKGYLDLMPDGEMEPLVYCERFRAEPWRDILVKVHRYVGRGFRNACVVRFNTSAPADFPEPPRITLVDSLQHVVLQHPEVAHDRRLNTPEAIETLRVAVEEAVQSWKAKRNGQAVPCGETNCGMLAEAVARTDSAQRPSSSFPWASHTGPTDRPNSDLARKPFPTTGRAPLTDQQKSAFPWNRTNLSRREASSSGEPAGAARVSVEHVDSYAPAISSLLSQSPQRHTREQSSVHEDDHSKRPVASKAKKTGQPTTVQKRQQKGGWRTKPLARG